ncbi:MAG TPA: hypothetical protein P5181_07990 [Dermatophilaceae bacterium]|nr:hypothetical protein [Dermatophilaceae bacterium]
MSRSWSSDPAGPWFRIGRLDVSTTVLVLLGCAVTSLAWVVLPSSIQIFALNPARVMRGFVWQLFTWPLGGSLISLMGILSAAMFWYFGTRIEEQIGRMRMAWLLGITVGAMGVLGVLASLSIGLPDAPVLGGIDLLATLVLLLFIAEYPNAPFFFGIPAWVVGVVIVGINVLQYLAFRQFVALLTLLAGLAVSALVARSYGLLTDYAWIPRIGSPRSPRQGRPKRSKAAREHKHFDPDRPTVVPFGTPQTPEQRELDALLDKISATGLASLTDKERARLQELSRRLRGQ